MMIPLRSSILWGETAHCRFTPQRHAFTYPIFFLSLDIAQLPALRTKLLGYNRTAVLSIRDDDYLRDSNGSIHDRFAALLGRSGVESRPAATYLLTVPRLFGYVFNPVNFYISVDADGQFHSLVAEVSNTFGETHPYVLPASSGRVEGDLVSFRFPKEFYVSPFLETAGEYRVSLGFPGEGVRIVVDLEQDGVKRFSASLEGRPKPLTDFEFLKSLLFFPLACIGTVARIQWQALCLVFLRRVQVFLKPRPSNPRTHVYRRSWVYAAREAALRRFKAVTDSSTD